MPAADRKPLSSSPGAARQLAASFHSLPDWATFLLGALLLAMLLFSPAEVAMDIQLDASNYGSYAYFTARHFQYGSEVIPMAGPYGFVPYGFTYAGSLFWERLGLELLTKFILGALIVWFFRRARERVALRWFWLASVALLIPSITDLPYILAILLSGLFLIEHIVIPGRRSLLASCGVAAYLALLTLFKGTQSMLALATFGLLFLQAVSTRNIRRLAWIIAAYLAALLGWLLAAGQNPLHFPRYFHGILELSSGYNVAMGLDEPMATFAVGLAIFFALQALVLMSAWARRSDRTAIAGSLLVAGMIFILWKHGFVRADGHVFIYFQFASLLALTVLLFSRFGAQPGWPRAIGLSLLLLVFTLSQWGNGKDIWVRFSWNFAYLPARVATTATQLFSPAQAKAHLNERLAAERQSWQLPRFQKLIGKASVDFFGNELGYLLLNRFNYRPRPMGGGTFNVFTPWLHDLNAAHVSDPLARPDYFVVNLQTIDDHFTAQDDAGTLLALLHVYTPTEVSSGLVLFKTREEAKVPAPSLVATVPFTWNQPIQLPAVREDQLLLMSFEAPANLAGRLRRALYKPPLIFMDLQGTGIGLSSDRKVIPTMFERPVLLNPVLETNEDLLDLIAGKPGKTVRSFTLKTRLPEYFDASALRVRFYTTPRPPATPHPPVTMSHTLVSAVDPESVEGSITFLARERELTYQVLVPPGRLVYPLKGDETELRFTYGMTTPTYALPTDGVEILVELQRDGQSPQVLFQQQHTPRQRPDQRGPQSVRLPLPPCPPGSKLYLRTGRGPDNDGAWDLVYLTGIAFTHGAYTAAQFPGFALLPQTVNGDMCGRFTEGNREIFLLNAPGALTFALPTTARSFQFKTGLLAGAYTGDGHSDGVEVTIELRTAASPPRQIFRHLLNPRANPEDRGDRTFDVPLPALAPGTQLILSLGPGPAGNASWDWSYISEVKLH